MQNVSVLVSLIALIFVASVFATPESGDNPPNSGAIPDTISNPRDPFQGENVPNVPNPPNPATITTAAPTKLTSSLPKDGRADHDSLTDEFLEAKKGFEQKYLDCDDRLGKIMKDFEDRITLHDHDDAKKLLKEMKDYKVDESVKDPCLGKEKVAPKSGSNGKNGKNGQTNGAPSCQNLGWMSFILLTLLTWA